MFLVWPAFQLEKWASDVWYQWSPSTAHFFVGAVLPLQGLSDVLWPALGTFLIVALVEEGLRYGLLFTWVRRSKTIDQVFDGLVIGIALGLGFATVENTLYFVDLFAAGNFDVLVFVFFLRFMVSTLAHIGFGGIMGTLLARAVFALYRKWQLYVAAFFLPWFLHGLYDFLLGINQTAYAVLILLPVLIVLVAWVNKRDFFVIERKDGKYLARPFVPESYQSKVVKKLFNEFESPWNANAPWLRERRKRYTILREIDRS
jgi:RsiW-degrading membrane proteinase PrsW (M82 family)